MKIIYVLLLSIITINISNGQIGKKQNVNELRELVGEINLFGGVGSTVNGKSKIYKILNENQFILTYQDQNYQVVESIVSIPFKGDDSDLDYLFNELRSCYKTPNKTYNISVGEHELEFSNTRSNIIQITSVNNGVESYFFTTSGGLYILFGKKWNKKEFKDYLKN
jgi:hypothetical protein